MAHFKIVGNKNPVVGVPEVYAVIDTTQKQTSPYLPNNSIDTNLFKVEIKQIKWTIMVYENGHWRVAKGEVKMGQNVNFTFLQKSLRYKRVRLVAEINAKEEIKIDIVPQRATQGQILRVEILDYIHDKPKAPFAYGQYITARVQAVDFEAVMVIVTLWEDDSKGAGHNEKNKYINSEKVLIVNGKADVPFYLSPNFEALANAGSNDEGSEHEYYVTAESEWSQPKIVSSPNFNIANEIKMPQMDVVSSLLTVEMLSEEEEEEKKKTGTCVCKEYDLIWGNKVSCDFRKKVVEIANRLGKDPNLLMAAMALETVRTFSPTAGKGTSYVGLIQFGDSAAESVGTTKDALLKMTAVQQLDYVEKYLAKKKDKLVTLTDFYLSILMPVDVGKGSESNHVVFDNEYPLKYKDDGQLTDLSKSRHYGYRQNPVFHFEKGEKEKAVKNGGKKYNGFGKTYIWEIEKYIGYIYSEGEINKKKVFLCNKNTISKPDIELGTWNVIVTEKYTGKKCTHEIVRNNCRRGIIEVYDHNKELVFTISDCLLEGVAGENRMITNADAPFGTYKISTSPFIMGSPSGSKRVSYGPNPRLSFEPIKGSGDEVDKSGRSAIRIHGGRQENKITFEPLLEPILKRTQGCIRIFDSDAKDFYNWWVDFHKTNPSIKPGKLKLIK